MGITIWVADLRAQAKPGKQMQLEACQWTAGQGASEGAGKFLPLNEEMGEGEGCGWRRGIHTLAGEHYHGVPRLSLVQ